jgi:hypothetical protein
VVEKQERHRTWLRRTEDDRWVARCTCGWGTPANDTVAAVRKLADEHEANGSGETAETDA